MLFSDLRQDIIVLCISFDCKSIHMELEEFK